MGKWHVNKHNIGQVLKGYIVFLLISLVCIVLVTLCIDNEYWDITKSKIIVPIIWLTASLLGTYATGQGGTNDGIHLPMLTCVLSFLSLLALGIFAFDGINGTTAIMGLIACMTGGIAGIMMQLRRKKRNRTRKRWRPSR